MKLGVGVTSLKSEEIFWRLSFCLRKMDIEIVKTIEKVLMGSSQIRKDLLLLSACYVYLFSRDDKK
jgi:hypothetical protein